ncbi:MAG: PAS domain-containing protein [Nanoarchaeota archaeon]
MNLEKIKNSILIIFLIIIVIIFTYTIISVNKYFNIKNYSEIRFEHVLTEFNLVRLIVSIFIGLLAHSIIVLFNRNSKALISISKNYNKTYSRFEDFANLLPEGLYETDTKGNFTFVSDSLIVLSQLNKKEDLLGKNIFQFITKEDQEKAKQEFKKRLDNIPSKEANEYNVITEGGELKSIALHATAINDINGNVIGTRGVVLNISELNKLKHDYKYNYDLLRLMINTMPIPIFFQNMKGEFIHFNPSFIKFCNKKHKDEIHYKTVFDVCPHEIARLFYKKVSDFMRSTDTRQKFHINSNGYDVCVQQAKFIDEKEKFESGIITVLQDLSILNNVKNELSLSEETFKVLTNQTIVGILIFKNKEIQYINDRLCNIIGYKKNEIISTKSFLLDLIYLDDINRFKNFIKRIQDDSNFKEKIRIKTKSGIIKCLEIDVKKINYEDSISNLFTIIDITPYINKK